MTSAPGTEFADDTKVAAASSSSGAAPVGTVLNRELDAHPAYADSGIVDEDESDQCESPRESSAIVDHSFSSLDTTRGCYQTQHTLAHPNAVSLSGHGDLVLPVGPEDSIADWTDGRPVFLNVPPTLPNNPPPPDNPPDLREGGPATQDDELEALDTVRIGAGHRELDPSTPTTGAVESVPTAEVGTSHELVEEGVVESAPTAEVGHLVQSDKPESALTTAEVGHQTSVYDVAMDDTVSALTAAVGEHAGITETAPTMPLVCDSPAGTGSDDASALPEDARPSRPSIRLEAPKESLKGLGIAPGHVKNLVMQHYEAPAPSGKLDRAESTEEGTTVTPDAPPTATSMPTLVSLPTDASMPELIPVGAAGQWPGERQAEEEEEDCEALEDEFRMCRAALRQVQADYRARVDRAAELEAQLRELDSAPRELEMLKEGPGEQLATKRRNTERLCMLGEEQVERSRRTLEQKSHQAEVLTERCRILQGKTQRLTSEPIAKDLAADVLKEKKQQVSTLSCDTNAQREKIAFLGADLRSVLDFMMRVNIEAAGGPAANLHREDMLPQHVRSELRLSPHGQACIDELFRKYKQCMRQLSNFNSDDEGSESSREASSPYRPKDDRDITPSFQEEAKLLRRACNAEMRRVAAALSEEASAVPRRQWAEREFLRASAWGDKETIEELMPVIAGESSADRALHGWTAWHAAAAHGQVGSVAVLKGAAKQNIAMPGLEQPTHCGLVPLAVACIQGHLELVRSLLLAEASVDMSDSRGNTPLLWAAAAANEDTVKDIAQVLLGAKADPSACNMSGQSVDLSFLTTSAAAAAESNSPPRPQADSGLEGDQEDHGMYYCIRASGKRQAEEGFLTKAVSQLKPPIRDSIGFRRKADSKVLSLLGNDEIELGVWSSWTTNYTHAGLAKVLEAAHAEHSPTHPHRSKQALVLTSERLLLLDASTWVLLEMISLSDIQRLMVSSYSETLLLLRLRRRSDVLLDIASRKRFINEAKLAISEVRWPGGGRDNPDPNRAVVVASEPMIPLVDGKQSRVGTLAFVEQDVFLLLSFAPASLLLSGPATGFFGFLDMQRRMQPKAAGAGVCWRWQRYFFLLKEGRGPERQLLWCHHPNATQAVDSAPISTISQVRIVDASYGDLCLVVERQAAQPGAARSGLATLTLRARSAKSREDWATAIRALQGPDR